MQTQTIIPSSHPHSIPILSSEAFLNSKFIHLSSYSKKICKAKAKKAKDFPQIPENALFSVPERIADIYSKPSVFFESRFDSHFDILEPYKNIALYPKEIQTNLYQKKPFEEIFTVVYTLKTPDDPFSFKKKIDRLKLLVLGQDKIVNDFLRGRLSRNKNQKNLQSFMDYVNHKNRLNVHIGNLLMNKKKQLKSQSNSVFEAGMLKMCEGSSKILNQINLAMMFKNVK